MLAGTRARRLALRDRARASLARADFGQLAAELAWRRLLPLIGTRALETASDLCPADFESHVAGARRAARMRGLAVEAETRRVTAHLAEEGIAALPLKGPLLAEAAHGDIGLRETDDIDVLVAPAQLHAAVERLRAEGYGEPGDPVRANGMPDLHFALYHPTGRRVELHWRTHYYDEEFAAEMLGRAESGPDGLLRAQPDDLAASLLLFYARDGFYGVRLATDIAGWWDRHGHACGAGFLEGHVRRYPRLLATFAAAAAAAERVTGAPVADWLGIEATGGRRVSLAARLGDWTQAGDRDQLAANISVVDGLLAPRGSAGEVARRELASRSGPSLPHALKTILRGAFALWRVRGGRWWSSVPSS